MSLSHYAGVAELADAQDLKSCCRNTVPVRFRSPALYLVFLGVQIISQVTREQPNNLALMICAAVLFIGVGVVYAGAAISSVWKMSRGGEKSQEDDLQIVEKEDSMETSQETRREIPDIQFKQEMPEQEEKEEKEAPIDTEEQSDSE